MARKAEIDSLGAALLIGFSVIFGFGQVAAKLGNEGFQPVFFAGLRSAVAAPLVLGWILLRGVPLGLTRRMLAPGLLCGSLFAGEFLCLFVALDFNSVVRTTIIFYSMPVWLALAAHVLLPGERITRRKAAGLALAFGGVAWAMGARGGAGEGTLAGDLMSLAGAFGWAGVALCARVSRLSRLPSESVVLWQLLVSAPLLILVAPAFGPVLRDPDALAWGMLAYQAVIVVALGILLWFWLLSVYPASGVASFGFLTPVFGILFGWLLLDEAVGPAVFGAGALVALGIWLINRPARATASAAARRGRRRGATQPGGGP
ncbi:MAG: DMT family transporter [Rhodobacteraceae bacterium]|jgi:drug/metabolite transporter (DMT)-like permease|nr:DMT family transporter [Paracoccaceae bacterium]